MPWPLRNQNNNFRRFIYSQSSTNPENFMKKGPVDVEITRLTEIHTYIHTFDGPFSGTTRVSRYQKGKTNLHITEATDSEWQWHQLGYMQVCTSLQTDNHTSTPPLSFFTGRMPFLPPNQQCQSTEGHCANRNHNNKKLF